MVVLSSSQRSNNLCWFSVLGVLLPITLCKDQMRASAVMHRRVCGRLTFESITPNKHVHISCIGDVKR